MSASHVGLEPRPVLYRDRGAAANAGELLPQGAYFSLSANSELETAMNSQPCKERVDHP